MNKLSITDVRIHPGDSAFLLDDGQTAILYDTGFGFPAYRKQGRTRIAGELLTVDDEGFRSMDMLEGYPRLYRREQIQVNLVGGGRVLAWVYVMNNLPKDAAIIEGGDWVRYRKGADAACGVAEEE